MIKNRYFGPLFLVFLGITLFTFGFAIVTTFKSSAYASTTASVPITQIKVKGKVPLKLFVFECGNILARDWSLFNPLLKKGIEKEMVDSCYLIQHPKGTLFWDFGLSDQLAKQEGGMEVMNGAFRMTVSKTLHSQLAKTQIDPEKITYVAFSHMHFDHTGNAHLFKKATWLMNSQEKHRAHGKEAAKYAYNPGDYSGIRTGKQIEFQGNYDVFKDGSVVILSTPGHTPGHQSLFIDLPKTGPVVLSGDLYHSQENRDNYAIPVFNTRKESIHSFVLMDHFLEQTGASLWIQHDLKHFNNLKKAPDFYK